MNTHLLILITLIPSLSLAQGPRTKGKGQPDGGNVELKANQPEAPAGFDTLHSGIARGRVIPFEYESKTGGGTFKATIYVPPSYVNGKKYPVLYLLHGASGDEKNWVEAIHADAILDNLHAAGKITPMLVVMPSSLSIATRAQAGNDREAKARANMAFGQILVSDLIPFVESKYPAISDREHRALAGLSMGAGAALATGLTNSDKFAWIGAFSGAGRRWSEPRENLRLLWLSVGDRDSLMGSGMVAVHAFFTERNVPHEFHVNAGGHEPKVWMNDLYHFAPRIFQHNTPTR